MTCGAGPFGARSAVLHGLRGSRVLAFGFVLAGKSPLLTLILAPLDPVVQGLHRSTHCGILYI
jgi:hypothetical protein